MPLPDFTDDEQYLIKCVKSPNATGRSSSSMWSYLISGAVVAGFGAYHSSIPMMITAFVVVCGFRIYEERFQNKWLPHWRSIILKYEAAARGEDDSDHAGGN